MTGDASGRGSVFLRDQKEPLRDNGLATGEPSSASRCFPLRSERRLRGPKDNPLVLLRSLGTDCDDSAVSGECGSVRKLLTCRKVTFAFGDGRGCGEVNATVLTSSDDDAWGRPTRRAARARAAVGCEGVCWSRRIDDERDNG